jgi:hypothetical protein
MKRLACLFFLIGHCILNAPFMLAQPEKVYPSIRERIIIDTDREVYIAGENVQFKLSLFQGQSFKYSELSKFAYVLLVNESGNSVFSFAVNLTNGIYHTNFLLPDTLRTGIYRLIAFTNWMRNFSPEKFAVRNLIVANRFDKTLDHFSGNSDAGTIQHPMHSSDTNLLILKYLMPEYHCGDSIVLLLCLPDSVVNKAGISISVSEEIAAEAINENEYIIKPVDDEEFRQVFTYVAEYNLPIFQGRVLKNGVPVPGEKILLTTPDSVTSFQYATTDNQGIFRFQLGNYYDNRRLVFKLMNSSDNMVIEYDDKFKINITGVNSPHLSQISDVLRHCQKMVTIQKSYFHFEQNKPGVTRQELPPMLYIKPVSTVLPSDFIDLSDMQDISREILPSVKIRKNNNEYTLEMFNASDQVFFKSKPLILYNGVPVDQLNQILHFGTSDINRIEVIDEPWVYGDLEFNGVLGLFSNNNQDIVSMGSGTLVVNNMKLQPSLRTEILYPGNRINSEHFPDFRQLLYWDPEVTVMKEKPVYIKLKAPRNEGTFTIVIKGTAGNDQPLTSCYTFLVKK